MRIAFANWSNRRVGGAETYVENAIPALCDRGHDVSLWTETVRPADRDAIVMPAGCASWSVDSIGLDRALSELAEWRPDLIYCHGLHHPTIERRVLDVVPAVFFAHVYHGTCISGAKTFTRPVVTPCDRRFGLGCLANYFPRRCGGRSPVTMVQQFLLQRNRLALLSRYEAIVTLSVHMQREYRRHGLSATCVYEVTRSEPTPDKILTVARHGQPDSWNLLSVGRLDRLKGVRELLLALSSVADGLGRQINVTVAGDGADRTSCEALATRVSDADSRLHVAFCGWLDRAELNRQFAASDLLVLPSVWPEPFALVGLEAARHSLPVAAFAVGGIPDWLVSGRNGVLAPGDPPTTEGLANAIVACLKDPEKYRQLRTGAASIRSDWAFNAHIERLLNVFRRVCRPADEDLASRSRVETVQAG